MLLFAKADEDCRSNDWGLPHYSAKDEVCSECLANRSTRPYTDLQEAKLECSADKNCIGISDASCTQENFRLCAKGDIFVSIVGACVFTRDN